MNKIIKSIILSVGISAALLAGNAVLADNEKAPAAETRVNGWDAIEAENEDKGSVYSVGSVSKVFVTTAVMQLVEQGKVELDKPVTEYISDFKMADDRYKDITVRMLMNHSSGIFGTSTSNMFLWDDTDDSHAEYVLEAMKSQRLKWAPGTAYAYCNDGFDLLQLIVERVSGMKYTDYVEKYINEPLGTDSIMTSYGYYNDPGLTDVYMNGMEYSKEYVTALGAGGIYCTAVDACEFGSSFFEGDNRLLSEKSKQEMSELQRNSDYDSDYGLGWDTVTLPQYESAGVKTLYKSGGTTTQHTGLLVAPEEEISVCVISSGGQSDELAVAESLMNIALEEKGIDIAEPEPPSVELKDEIPEEYRRYEGIYGSGTGALLEVDFSDNNKYMIIREKTDATDEVYFQYTDQGFVKISGDVDTGKTDIAPDFLMINFIEDSGKVYIKYYSISNRYGFEKNEHTSLKAEKLEVNPVSEEVLSAWKNRDGKKYAVISDKYSSAIYDTPFIKIHVIEDMGYVLYSGYSSGVLKIEDENNALAFETIPDDANRDLIDVCISGDTLTTSNGWTGIESGSYELFTADIKDIELESGCAKWYSIDDSLSNSSITVERPENSSIYVYDKFGSVIYSTHMKEYGENIPLPKNGSIVFVGETGDTMSISK